MKCLLIVPPLCALTVAFVGPALAAEPAGHPTAKTPTFELSTAIADGPPLEIEVAAEKAVEAAPSLKRARALSLAAEAAVSSARSGMIPRLELRASYQRVGGFDDGSISVGGQIGAVIEVPRNRFGLSGRLTWPVSDLLFSVLPAIEAAEARVNAETHQEKIVVADVRRSTYETYYALARARGALYVADEAKRNAAEQLAQVAASVRAGYLTEADRLSAEARVAERHQASAAAAAGVAVANATLRVLIDVPPGAPFGVSLPPIAAVEADVELALTQRPEIRAIKASVDAQRAISKVEGARGYPHLAAFAGADYARPNRYQIPPQDVFTPSWEFGAMLTWVPNDTLTSMHRTDQLDQEIGATRARLEQIEQGIRLEVIRSAAEIDSARTAVDAARIAERAARAAYDARRAALEAGENTTAELLAAEDQLYRARLAKLDAEVMLRLSTTRLSYAMGTL